MTELDPKPWSTRKSWNDKARRFRGDEKSTVFSEFDPRPEYEQDESKYL